LPILALFRRLEDCVQASRAIAFQVHGCDQPLHLQQQGISVNTADVYRVSGRRACSIEFLAIAASILNAGL
jgi:hypothetical protein